MSEKTLTAEDVLAEVEAERKASKAQRERIEAIEAVLNPPDFDKRDRSGRCLVCKKATTAYFDKHFRQLHLRIWLCEEHEKAFHAGEPLDGDITFAGLTILDRGNDESDPTVEMRRQAREIARIEQLIGNVQTNLGSNVFQLSNAVDVLIKEAKKQGWKLEE